MRPDPIYRIRLMVLANHLRTRRGLEVFDFGFVHAEGIDDLQGLLSCYNEPKDHVNPAPVTCGTAGCAIGEMPYCWPKHLEFIKHGGGPAVFFKDRSPVPVTRRSISFEAAEEWFGLCHTESCHLFAPNEQDTDLWGGKELGRLATPVEVASGIEAFVAFQNVRLGALDPLGVAIAIEGAIQDQRDVLGRPSGHPAHTQSPQPLST